MEDKPPFWNFVYEIDKLPDSGMTQALERTEAENILLPHTQLSCEKNSLVYLTQKFPFCPCMFYYPDRTIALLVYKIKLWNILISFKW